MSLPDFLSVASISVGALFFLAGTVGLLRLPDAFSRLHALTKADNLGLGFVTLGLAFQALTVLTVLKLVLIWLLALLAGSSTCYLIGRRRLERRLEDGEGR